MHLKIDDLKPEDIVIFYYPHLKEINNITRRYDTVDKPYKTLVFGCLRKGLFINVEE